MKLKLIAFGLMAGLLTATSTSALSIQKNVRAGVNPIDGTTVITRYSSNRLPSWYRLGVEQQGYNESVQTNSSYTTLPEFRGDIDIDPTVVAPHSDGSHRLMQFRSRSSRLRNAWANLFE